MINKLRRLLLPSGGFKPNTIWRKRPYTSDVLLNPITEVIYLAIPKCSNSTLKSAFVESVCADLNLVLPISLEAAWDYSALTDPVAREVLVQNGLVIDRDDVAKYSRYTVFAAVRDPYDRLVSCWRDKIRPEPITDWRFVNGVHRGFLRYRGKFHYGMSFSDFARSVCEIPDLDANGHFRSQTDFLTDRRGTFLPSLLIDSSKVDVMMQDQPANVRASFGSMEPRNRSMPGSAVPALTEDLKSLVKARFRSDYELYSRVSADIKSYNRSVSP